MTTNANPGGFQFTPSTGLLDITTYPQVPASESAARQQFMDLFNQLLNEINYPTNSAAAFLSVLRNALINGGFSVNQRGKTGTVTLTAGQYGHDRWKAGASGCTYTFATTNNVTTITITAGSLIQVIEGVNLFSGTYTLSWTGSAQGKIGAGSYGATGITGTVVGGTNLNIEFNTGTLSQVQFNAGSTALPFQPRSFAEELALCQRYYEKSYNIDVPPATASSNPGLEFKVLPSNTVAAGQHYGKTKFRVAKRVIPTVTIYPYTTPSNTGTVSINSGADQAASTGLTSVVGTDGFNTYNGNAASYTTTLNTINFHWAADAEL